MSDLSFLAKKRYTTKAFDPTKTIPADKIAEIKTLLQFSPSSTNSQPWHFVLASTAEGKSLIAQSTEHFAFNTQKILNASHVVVLCTRTQLDEAHLLQVLEQEAADGRFANEEAKQGQHNGRSFFANMHKNELKDAQHWMEKQVYLALGTLMLGASVLDIDACPIEGFDATKLNQVLGLREKGFCASVVVALGYRSEEDFNAKLPKSRLAQEVIFTEI
ncbi:oxygen-insensitive NAD(P)H nitroreductase [Shewanella bicestrii]|uniref:oxygen-insensitive NAD(P)H nitroreductase n=1 Tax=Shewanella TaxID=22 RepID=UPI000D64E39E|nr:MULTISPECIES: oxygen-insensitive NAD(P)H nitroreductase [Shewanella]MCL1119128.1 oxygen-insensitive NAD(P)H nitroreductase [Shewanella seohaensis]PWF63000.1 NAD(P)H nitroreductase [Shewanella sp. BC20]UXM81743.1 oxygen-insensitive NAD(P)H nitroreductase [Shewanella seohaensis]